jgi:hypothetical protein
MMVICKLASRSAFAEIEGSTSRLKREQSLQEIREEWAAQPGRAENWGFITKGMPRVSSTFKATEVRKGRMRHVQTPDHPPTCPRLEHQQGGGSGWPRIQHQGEPW